MLLLLLLFQMAKTRKDRNTDNQQPVALDGGPCFSDSKMPEKGKLLIFCAARLYHPHIFVVDIVFVCNTLRGERDRTPLPDLLTASVPGGTHDG